MGYNWRQHVKTAPPFHEHLRQLGYASYGEYLASEHWAAKKDEYRNCGRLQVCFVCDRPPPVDLHHRTYKRLGAESVKDLVPLCRRCHTECHDYLKKRPGRLYTAARRMRCWRTGETPHEAGNRLAGDTAQLGRKREAAVK